MRSRLVVLSVLLAAVLAGCGGGSTTVQQVPGPPVALDEPGNASALAPTPTPTATATASATTAPSTSSSTTGTTGTTGTGTTGTGTSGGAGTQTGSTGNDTQPPPAGSDAQKFEDFCAQNPGAC